MSQATALSALEGRKLVRHPIFLAGFGLALLGCAVFIEATVSLPATSWSENGWTVFVGCILLGLLTLVASNHAALRDRRERTVEQHGALPVAVGTRTAGLLLAISWPAAAGALLLTMVTGYSAAVPSGAPVAPLDLVRLALLVLDLVMFGTLGVAVARWIPSAFFAPLVAFGFILSAPGEHPARWQVLSPLAQINSVDFAIWHLAYIASLTAIWCAAALLKDGLRRAWVPLGIGGLAVAAVSISVLLSQACPGGVQCLT